MKPLPIKPLAGVWAVAASLTVTAALVIAALTVLGSQRPDAADLPAPLTPDPPAPLVEHLGPRAPRGRAPERHAAARPAVVARRHVVVVHRRATARPKPRRDRAHAHRRRPARHSPPAPRPAAPVVGPREPVVVPAPPAPPAPVPVAVAPTPPAPAPDAPAAPAPEIQLRLRDVTADDGGRWVVAGFELTGPAVSSEVELRLRAAAQAPDAPASVISSVDIVRTDGLQLRVRAGDGDPPDAAAVSNAVSVTVPLGDHASGDATPPVDQLLLPLDGDHGNEGDGGRPLLGAGATTVDARLESAG